MGGWVDQQTKERQKGKNNATINVHDQWYKKLFKKHDEWVLMWLLEGPFVQQLKWESNQLTNSLTK